MKGPVFFVTARWCRSLCLGLHLLERAEELGVVVIAAGGFLCIGLCYLVMFCFGRDILYIQ